MLGTDNVVMKNYLFVLLGILAAQCLLAQEGVYDIFNDRWVINSPSVEMLPQYKLDARITHRFSDLAGEVGGWPTFYGLENAADVAFGVEYGLTNDLTLGVARSKGAGQLRQLVSMSGKYRIFQQRESGMPLSLVLFGMTSVSTAQKSTDASSMNYFEKFQHRMVDHFAIVAGRKFSSRFSLQLAAGLTHRNVVPNGEENNLLSTGMSFRLRLSKTLGLIGEASLPLNGLQSPFRSLRPSRATYYPPVGIGFMFDTGGHVFQLNFTNATGIMPTDYIPYTRSNWLDGEFRIGFTISRIFNL
jgi:uncharacterized beta barrel domain-containing protein DUF5777